MRRVFVAFALLLAFAFAMPSTSAQDATPMAGGTPTASLLASLGYPDLVVTTDGTTNDLPAELPAGRYHVVLNNTNPTNMVDLSFFMPPVGTSEEDAVALYAAVASAEDILPEMFYQLTMPGGIAAVPNGMAEGIIDLSPGDWYAGLQIENEEGPSTGTAQSLAVTGDMPALTDPPAAVTATLSDFKIDIPDSVSAGPQIWKVTNTGAVPHFLVLSMSDGSLTQENVQETLGSFIGTPMPADATPIAGDALADVTQTGVLSPGQTMWVEVDLQSGQYLAACYLTGPDDLPMHAAMGMFKIFDAA